MEYFYFFLYFFLFSFCIFFYIYIFFVNFIQNEFYINFLLSTFNKLLNFYEELIVIFFIYNFIKIVIFSSITELSWPTHFFNKRNNFYNSIKIRNLYENILKIKNINSNKNVFNKNMIKFI